MDAKVQTLAIAHSLEQQATGGIMKYKRGSHPESKKNLLKSATPFYEEKKRGRHIAVTDTGWDGIKAIAKDQDLTISQLIEKIGRKEIILTYNFGVVQHGKEGEE